MKNISKSKNSHVLLQTQLIGNNHSKRDHSFLEANIHSYTIVNIIT